MLGLLEAMNFWTMLQPNNFERLQRVVSLRCFTDTAQPRCKSHLGLSLWISRRLPQVTWHRWYFHDWGKVQMWRKSFKNFTFHLKYVCHLEWSPQITSLRVDSSRCFRCSRLPPVYFEGRCVCYQGAFVRGSLSPKLLTDPSIIPLYV